MLTKEMLEKLRRDINTALDAVAASHNGEFKVGNIKYDDNSAKIELTFLINGEDGETAEQLEFNKYARAYGFDPVDYGKTLFVDGVPYQFVGFLPKARKYPCLLRNANTGREIKATLESVQSRIMLDRFKN